MSSRNFVLAVVLLALCMAVKADSWSYTIGQMRVDQQANFCDNQATVDELAAIFQRFGPQTGYSALAGAPDCSLRVHSFTPVELKKSIRVKLESGDYYTINTIRVELEDGQTLYLFTTRKLQEAN